MECTYWVIQSPLSHWLGRFAPPAVILIGEFSPRLLFNCNQTEIYYILIYKDDNNFFLWNLTVYFEILNFEIGKKYYELHYSQRAILAALVEVVFKLTKVQYKTVT